MPNVHFDAVLCLKFHPLQRHVENDVGGLLGKSL